MKLKFKILSIVLWLLQMEPKDTGIVDRDCDSFSVMTLEMSRASDNETEAETEKKLEEIFARRMYQFAKARGVIYSQIERRKTFPSTLRMSVKFLKLN